MAGVGRFRKRLLLRLCKADILKYRSWHCLYFQEVSWMRKQGAVLLIAVLALLLIGFPLYAYWYKAAVWNVLEEHYNNERDVVSVMVERWSVVGGLQDGVFLFVRVERKLQSGPQTIVENWWIKPGLLPPASIEDIRKGP